MRTLLYINDTICSSIEQLRNLFSKELSPDTPIYEDLLTLQRDGELAQWLAEGNTEEEKALANKVNQLSKSTPNSELIKQLTKIFVEEGKIIKPSFSTYIDILKVSLINSKRKLEIKDSDSRDEILVEKEELSASVVSLELKIKKVDNELLPFKLIENKSGHYEEKQLSLEGLKHGTVISVSLPFPSIDYDFHEMEIISISERICRFNLFVIKSEKAYVKFDDYKAFRLDKVRLGLTTAKDFQCEDNGTANYKGASLIFHNGFLSGIKTVKGTEAFHSLIVLLLKKEDADNYGFYQIYDILINMGFKPGKSSLKLNVVSQAFESIIRPSSIMTRGLFSHLSLARDVAANIVKASDNSATYKDELIKETGEYICTLNFYSGNCSGYDKIDNARYKSGTLEEITVYKK